jgi:hypothetical protein
MDNQRLLAVFRVIVQTYNQQELTGARLAIVGRLLYILGTSNSMIIDSKLNTIEEALQGSDAPSDVQNSLSLITVTHLSFDGLTHRGQLVIHTDLAEAVSYRKSSADSCVQLG